VATPLAPGLREEGQVVESHMRKPVHFDGEPDLFARTKALFAQTSRLRVRYPTADMEHHVLPQDQKRESLVATAWSLLKRTA
jgi:hypothetical protein